MPCICFQYSLALLFLGNWPVIEENLHQITYHHVPGQYKDITDGHIYRTEVPQNPDENNVIVISLAWHIDGSAAVKSKDIKLWPIFAIIIEVPKIVRYSFYNVLFGMGSKNQIFSCFKNDLLNKSKCS